MKKCIRCHKSEVKNSEYDLCWECWQHQKLEEEHLPVEVHFENNLDFNEIHTVYIMFYEKTKKKIGYTRDLNSRFIEIKCEYPDNQLVYFREFIQQTDAMKFEYWLKKLNDRDLHKFIVGFQDKLRKVLLI